VDYTIWEYLKDHVYQKCMRDVDKLTIYDKASVTCGLTAKKPGSAQCQTLVTKYGTNDYFFSVKTSS